MTKIDKQIKKVRKTIKLMKEIRILCWRKHKLDIIIKNKLKELKKHARSDR